MDLTKYLSAAIDRIVRQAVRQTLRNPRESAFLLKYAAAQKAAAKKHHAAEALGRHIPPFLIASIASECNLRCSGCYARANGACSDEKSPAELTAAEWARIFREAAGLGIAFILLAGGEPLLRRDVLEEAARIPDIAFPVFTNGTMIDGRNAAFFDGHRNLIPILSVEGGAGATDERRGAGTHAALLSVMERLRTYGVLFGTSVTVTSQNLQEITNDAFPASLEDAGCGIVIFVEYVPIDGASAELALSEQERAQFDERLENARKRFGNMLFISFPGDEMAMGGCLAAGRGFFHINPAGGAEPCPFSPYSDINVREHSLTELMDSPLFLKLRQGGILSQEHTGGCTLFEQKEEIAELME